MPEGTLETRTQTHLLFTASRAAGYVIPPEITPLVTLKSVPEVYQAWKSNDDFFHRLVISDAIRHLPTIKRLAESSYPLLATSPQSFVITIDYLAYPPKAGLHLLSEHDRYSLRKTVKFGPTAELHNDELIQRALNEPGKYGIIQSKRTEGQQIMHVLTIVPGDVWEAEWVAVDHALQRVD